jgi:hypothetical protein
MEEILECLFEIQEETRNNQVKMEDKMWTET